LWLGLAACQHLWWLSLGACQQAKDAAEVKELIDRATSTPKGHKKDITSDMFKGYCPPAVEAAW